MFNLRGNSQKQFSQREIPNIAKILNIFGEYIYMVSFSLYRDWGQPAGQRLIKLQGKPYEKHHHSCQQQNQKILLPINQL